MTERRTWWRRFRDALMRRRPFGTPRDRTFREFMREGESPEADASGAPPLAFDVPSRTDAILGLDLGTSCTKVVIRTPFLGGGRAVAVPVVAHEVVPLRYLIPTAIAVRDDGSIEIPLRDRIPATWHSLKVAVMDAPHDIEARARMAAYLAVVGRRGMTWFVQSQRKILGSCELNWMWNLGIPSNGCETQSPVDAAFRAALTAAKRLAGGDRPIRLEDARKLVEEHPTEDPSVSTVPEVVAEVVGYARSHHREPGMHVLVDVGATTVDVCSFALTRTKGEDGYGILTASVERLGIHELHRVRLRELEALGRSDLRRDIVELELSDFLLAIPASISEYLSSGSPGGREMQIDQDFAKRCTNQTMSCMGSVRRNRHRASPAWQTGIPTFLCGGGASSPFYRQVLEAASDRCVRSYDGVAPLRIQQLPIPLQLNGPGLNAPVFSRLAVAYGLSFDVFDIGHIVPPDLIPDEPPLRRREPVDMISKDQV